jgi:putative aldouronate transport system substrate-binding protein
MRRAVNEDPDGNGPRDTWGVGTDYSWPIVCNAIFGKPAGDFNVVNGRFVDWFSTPGYRDALAFRAQIYQEGLLDPEYITDGPNFTRQKQFLVTGKIAMRFQGIGFQGDYFDFIRNVPDADFVPIEPLQSSYGRFGFGLETPFLKMVLMSKNARNPKAIMEYMDWLITDGYFTLSFGLEGQHYRLVNGVPQVIDAARNRIEVDYIKGNSEFALVDAVHTRWNQSWIPIQSAQDPISQDWARRYAQAVNFSVTIPHVQHVPYNPTSPAIENFNIATTGLSSQVYALETSIMIGRLSVDEGLRQINEYKKSVGWDAVNAEKDRWYQANKHLFNK